MQFDVAGLKDGPDLDGERLAARIAFVGAYASALAAQLAATLDNAAVRTDPTVRPDTRFYKLIGRVLVVEVRGGKIGHGASRLPLRYGGVRLGYVKYNFAEILPLASLGSAAVRLD